MESFSAGEYGVTPAQWESVDFNFTMESGSEITVPVVSHWAKLRKDPIYRTSVNIHDNYQFIFSGIGVPCNILSFLVLMRIKPVTSAILVMMILAVMDSLKLSIDLTYQLTTTVGVSYNNIGCSLWMTAKYLLQYYPIWLVVLLTLERVIAVCFPLKAVRMCTLSNARRSVIGLFIFDVLVCILHTFLYEERTYGKRYACYIKSKYQTMYDENWIYVDVTFFVIIPLLILCLGNIAIIFKLRTKTELSNTSDGSISDQDSRRQNRSITIMLLAVCITTIVFLTPNALFCIPGFLFSPLTADGDIRAYALNQLAVRIIMVFTHANNAVNFFLYILTGRRFRRVLYEMINSWLGRTMIKVQ